MNLTDFVAWWGAIVATFVLLWDVYKWTRRGPDVRVEAVPNMEVFHALPHTGDTHFIFITATNHGAQPTTITHLAGVYYPSLWYKLTRRRDQSFVVLINAFGPPLPHVLSPGARWTGAINQNDLIKNYGTTGRVYCGVIHSHSKKAVFRHVRFK